MSGGGGGNLENYTKLLHQERYYGNPQHFPISNFKEHLLRLGGTHLVANIVPWFLSSFCIASKGRVSCTVLRHFFIKQSFNQEKMSCKLCPLFSQLTHPDQRFCKGNENLFKGNNLAAWNQMCRKCFRE